MYKGYDDYFIKLYKKYYCPENEIKKRRQDAYNLAEYLVTAPDLLDPIWDWFLSIYFYGLDEGSQAIMFEEDIKKFAKQGYNCIPLVLNEAVGSIAESSPIGFIIDAWDMNVGFDSVEREKVLKILEKIKVKTPLLFDIVDWDTFFNVCWPQLFINVFEHYYGTTYKRATENIINEKINKILKNYGLEMKFIKQISNNNKMSCIGVDMSKVWDAVIRSQMIIKVPDTHLATSGDVG